MGAQRNKETLFFMTHPSQLVRCSGWVCSGVGRYSAENSNKLTFNCPVACKSLWSAVCKMLWWLFQVCCTISCLKGVDMTRTRALTKNLTQLKSLNLVNMIQICRTLKQCRPRYFINWFYNWYGAWNSKVLAYNLCTCSLGSTDEWTSVGDFCVTIGNGFCGD